MYTLRVEATSSFSTADHFAVSQMWKFVIVV